MLENVYVMAGVPSVFKAMVETVLPRLTGGAPLVSRTLRIHRGEGDIAGPLGLLAERFAELSMGSYPFQQKNGRYGSNVVIRGEEEAQVDQAMKELRAAFRE